MSEQETYTLSCATCQSKYELLCTDVSYEYHPDYCPFCGSTVDEEDDDEEKEDENYDEDWDNQDRDRF